MSASVVAPLRPLPACSAARCSEPSAETVPGLRQHRRRRPHPRQYRRHPPPRPSRRHRNAPTFVRRRRCGRSRRACRRRSPASKDHESLRRATAFPGGRRRERIRCRTIRTASGGRSHRPQTLRRPCKAPPLARVSKERRARSCDVLRAVAHQRSAEAPRDSPSTGFRPRAVCAPAGWLPSSGAPGPCAVSQGQVRVVRVHSY